LQLQRARRFRLVGVVEYPIGMKQAGLEPPVEFWDPVGLAPKSRHPRPIEESRRGESLGAPGLGPDAELENGPTAGAALERQEGLGASIKNRAVLPGTRVRRRERHSECPPVDRAGPSQAVIRDPPLAFPEHHPGRQQLLRRASLTSNSGSCCITTRADWRHAGPAAFSAPAQGPVRTPPPPR
jgi:hypothetical protein